MEPPREEAAPATQVMDPPQTEAAPLVPDGVVSPFPMAEPRRPTARPQQISWSEMRRDVQPANHPIDGPLTVDLPAPDSPPVMVVKAPEPPPEELMPPSDPWGAGLPKSAAMADAPRTPPKPA